MRSWAVFVVSQSPSLVSCQVDVQHFALCSGSDKDQAYGTRHCTSGNVRIRKQSDHWQSDSDEVRNNGRRASSGGMYPGSLVSVREWPYSDVQKRPEQVQRQVLLEPGIGRLRGPPVLQAARDALVEEKARLVDACLPIRLKSLDRSWATQFLWCTASIFQSTFEFNNVSSVHLLLSFLNCKFAKQKIKSGIVFSF